MANSNLTKAKNAKNDEFYTQYADIQKEIEAYLEFDPDTFRGKVVYCNCDDPLESNFFGFFADNFKRLGLKRLITTSFKPSPVANTLFDLSLYGEEQVAKGRDKDFAARFIIDDVGDYNGDGSFNRLDLFEKLKANKHNEWQILKGDADYSPGDFRSAECVELLKQADIVVTNPPFSLYREYVAQLIEYDKKFVIIGSKNTITYKEIFPLIKDNRLWVGTSSFSRDILFIAPRDADLSGKPKTAVRVVDGVTYLRSPSVWFTNLDHGRRHQPLQLRDTKSIFKRPKHKIFEGRTSFERYDNYDAIEVPFTDSIPSDYDGVMGVPISFLDKYDPEQFEIVGMCENEDLYKLKTRVYTNQEKKDAYLAKFGKAGQYDLNASGVVYRDEQYEKVYQRVLIKHRKAVK